MVAPTLGCSILAAVTLYRLKTVLLVCHSHEPDVLFVESREVLRFFQMKGELLIHMSDDHLVARYVGTGSERYFEELWRRYSREIFLRCLRVVRNPSIAEELTSETFVKALRGVGAYEPGHFKGWL